MNWMRERIPIRIHNIGRADLLMDRSSRDSCWHVGHNGSGA